MYVNFIVYACGFYCICMCQILQIRSCNSKRYFSCCRISQQVLLKQIVERNDFFYIYIYITNKKTDSISDPCKRLRILAICCKRGQSNEFVVSFGSSTYTDYYHCLVSTL